MPAKIILFYPHLSRFWIQGFSANLIHPLIHALHCCKGSFSEYQNTLLLFCHLSGSASSPYPNRLFVILPNHAKAPFLQPCRNQLLQTSRAPTQSLLFGKNGLLLIPGFQFLRGASRFAESVLARPIQEKTARYYSRSFS